MASKIVDLESIIAKFWNADNRIRLPEEGKSTYTKFDNTNIASSLLSIEYTTEKPLVTPMNIATTSWNNGTSVQDTQTYADSQTTTASYTWSVTAGVKIGDSLTFETGLPFEKAGFEIHVDLNFSTSQSHTVTKTQTWSWSDQIPVPAHSSVTATITVDQAKYSPEFTADIGFKGIAFATNENGTFNYKIGVILDWYTGTNPFTGFSYDEKDDWSGSYAAKGVFAGVQGVGQTVSTAQKPYNKKE